MKQFSLKFGHKKTELHIDKDHLIGEIKLAGEAKSMSEEDIIRQSLKNPIASQTLDRVISPDDQVCIVISDVTRMYQRPHIFLPILVDELIGAGAKEENIFFISALGSHRKHTEDEHKKLLGDSLYGRFHIEDHDCNDADNLVEIGTTSRGTVVEVNKKAAQADKVIMTGAVVYHVMAGWGGGRKSVLPGIASRKSIMMNHAISMERPENLTSGPNPLCDCALYDNNPLNLDMIEAAEMFNPAFMFNVILGGGEIIAAVSGDITVAHKKGCQMVSEFNDVEIQEKGDMIIASGGGFPKDLNFYQSTKVIYNAMRAIHEDGILIILASCSEGFGHPEVQHIIQNFKDNPEREEELHSNYTIAKYIGYLACWYATKYNIIYVSDIDAKDMDSSDITIVKTLDEALETAYKLKGRRDLKTYVMPDGNLFPVMK